MMVLDGRIPGVNANLPTVNTAQTTNPAPSQPDIQPSFIQAHTQAAPFNIQTAPVESPPVVRSLGGASSSISSPRRGARTKVAARPSAFMPLTSASSSEQSPAHLRPTHLSKMASPGLVDAAKTRGFASLGPRSNDKSSQPPARPSDPAASPRQSATQSASIGRRAVTPTPMKEPMMGSRPWAGWRPTPPRPRKRRRIECEPDDIIDLTGD